MEPIVLWQTKWSHGPYVPMYLFFGGLTAGIFIIAVLLDFLSWGWKRGEILSKVGAYSAVVTLALAGFFLTVHLGKPERGLAFPLFFTNYNSWMTRGGWIVGSTSPLIVLYAALRYFGIRSWLRRLVGLVGIPAAALFTVYTGVLLSQAGFVPLWSKQFLPLLFLNSGLTTGLAATGFIFLLAWPFLKVEEMDPWPIVRWVSLMLVVFILLELYELYAFMTFLRISDQRAPTGQFMTPHGGAMAYQYVTGFPADMALEEVWKTPHRWERITRYITESGLAPWFWWGVIGVGLIIPLVLTLIEFLVRPLARWIAMLKFALVLVGGALLRFVIVWGGNLKAPLAFPPSKWPIPLGGG